MTVRNQGSKLAAQARQRGAGRPVVPVRNYGGKDDPQVGGQVVPGQPAGSPAPGNPAAPPFLNPTQQYALNTFDRGIGDRIRSNQRTVSDATFDTGLKLTANQKAHTVSTSTENQNDAARGIFLSSIRAGDLNDIDATLATRNNIANTSLWRIITDRGADTNSAIGSWGDTHNFYNQLAIANAQAITPVVGPAGSPAAGVTGTAGPGAGITKGQYPANGIQAVPRHSHRGPGFTKGQYGDITRGPRQVPRGQQGQTPKVPGQI